MMEESEKIQILSDLVGIRTVGGNETQVANYLVKLLKHHGIHATKVNYSTNRDNLVAEIGNGNGPVLAFSGHQDVVHEGNLDSWKSDPFKATIKNGKIYGRGTSDMKGGLAGMLIAMIELHDAKVELNGTLRLLVTVEEEVGELGSHELLEKGYASDINALITGEPTSVPISQLHDYFASGAARITKEELYKLTQAVDIGKAREQNFVFYAHKGWLMTTVTSHGKAAHSSMPGLGVNAIDGIVKYYLAEKAYYDHLHIESPILGKTIYAPTIIEGGHQINSIPDKAKLQAKIRTIPEVSNKKIILDLQAIAAELNKNVNINLTFEYESKQPVISNPNSKLIKIIREVTGHILNELVPVPPIAVSLGTDASELSQGNDYMDVAIIGPGNNTAHQANEYVEQDMYLNMIKVYQKIAQRYLC